jgi:hypothetical protein
MKRTITGALLLFGSLAANAANPGRTYDAPFDKVWIACVQAASEKYVVTHSEKESGILSFEQGPSWKSNSWGTDVGVSVIKISDTQTEVIVHPQKKQAQLFANLGSISKTFFKAVEEKLKQN